MRKTGPKRAPKNLNIVSGNDPEITKPPAYLSKRAKEIWREKISSISSESWSAAKEPLFASWCQNVEIIEECSRILDKEGLTVLNGVGTPVSRPEVKILAESQRLLLTLSRQLGVIGESAVSVKPGVEKQNTENYTDHDKRRARLFGIDAVERYNRER